MQRRPTSRPSGNQGWPNWGDHPIVVGIGIAAALIAFFSFLTGSGNGSTENEPSALCTIAASEISIERVIIGVNDSINVSVRANNPIGQPLLFNWQAVNGKMTPGLRSNSPQSMYFSPDYPVDDTISVDITLPDCPTIRRSKQISVIQQAPQGSGTTENSIQTIQTPNVPNTSISLPTSTSVITYPDVALETTTTPILETLPQSSQPIGVERLPLDRQRIARIQGGTPTNIFFGELYISFEGNPAQPSIVSVKAPGYVRQSFTDIQLGSLFKYEGRNIYSILMSDYNDPANSGGSPWIEVIVTKLNTITLEEPRATVQQEQKVNFRSTPTRFFYDGPTISFDEFTQETGEGIHIVVRSEGFVRQDYYDLKVGDKVTYITDTQYTILITDMHLGDGTWFDNSWIMVTLTKVE